MSPTKTCFQRRPHAFPGASLGLAFQPAPRGPSLCRALALNCSAPINDKKGAEAKDWRSGKPVRVVRNMKGGKHSKYAPAEGNRYDGIYKVVKYWPEKGKSGFLVWRYLLRRDDDEPGPWTKEGKDRIKRLGLTMQVRQAASCRGSAFVPGPGVLIGVHLPSSWGFPSQA